MNSRIGLKKLGKIAASALLGAAFSLSAPAAGIADIIKLGAPIPVTGPFSSDGAAMEKGIRLAIDELNAKGGLLGKQVEISIFDIGDLTPDKLQAAAANLIERNAVDVLINGYGGMGPDIPAFCPFNQPYIHNDATSNVIELRDRLKCGNIFMGSDVDFSYGKIAFRQMTKLGYDFPNKNMAIVHGPYDWELNNPAGATEVAKADGWTVVAKQEAPYGTTEWTGILANLRAAKPSLIYMELLDPAAVKTFIDQFTANPIKGALVFVGYTMSVPAFEEIAATGAADGILGMTLSAHQQDDAGKDFVAKWKAKYNEDPPFSIAAQIFDEVMLWAGAVNKAGDVKDFAAITKALANANYKGITGTFKFNKQQFIDAGDDTLPAHLLQVQGGKVRQLMIGSQTVSAFTAPAWAK